MTLGQFVAAAVAVVLVGVALLMVLLLVAVPNLGGRDGSDADR